jgi:hypothetical protein
VKGGPIVRLDVKAKMLRIHIGETVGGRTAVRGDRQAGAPPRFSRGNCLQGNSRLWGTPSGSQTRDTVAVE